MKRYIPLVIALLAAWTHHARADEPTLLKDSDYWNFYFQPDFYWTEVNKDSAEFLGAEIGASLNERFDIGVLAQWLINDVTLDAPRVDKPEEGQIWTGGLMLRYHLSPGKLLDFSFQTLIAGGRIETGNKTDGNDGDTDFMIIEPGMYLTWNLTQNAMIGARLSYRIADGSDSELIRDDDLTGPGLGVFFRLDEF